MPLNVPGSAMQRNDNPFVALRQTHSLSDILHYFMSWLDSDGEAQRFFEKNRHAGSTTVSRPLSQHSTLTGSSGDTISSADTLPINVPISETDRLPSNITAPICNDPSSSHASARPAQYLGGWNTSLFINRGPKQPPKPSRRPSSRGETPPDPELECPFCAEIGFTPLFKRSQDVRKHLTKFHKENDVWICPREDCRLAFDRKTRFESHFKQDHSRVPADLPDAQVKLHPQLVFACGFEMCRYILEAKDEQDAVEKVGLYHDHIVNNHLGNNPQEKWSHARRFKNLMHQEGLRPYWRDRKKNQEGRWKPQIHTSFVLMKIIDTRRYCDPVSLVQLVEDIGYPPHNSPLSPFFPLPPGLSDPLEVGFSEDTPNDVMDGPADAPGVLPVDHSVAPTTNSMGHGGSLVNFQLIDPPYVPVSQNSGTCVPQFYGIDRPWGDYPQHGPKVNPAHLEEDTFGSYQTSSFAANNPAHHLSQYPSGPLESNQHASEYHDNMAVDPRLLTLNQNYTADLSTNLETNYGPVHTGEDHS